MKKDRALFAVSIAVLAAIVLLWYRQRKPAKSEAKAIASYDPGYYFPGQTSKRYEFELVQYKIDQQNYDHLTSDVGCGCG